MRIVIDMQGAQTGSRLRGIGRYSMALAQAMVRNRGEHEVILMLNGMFPETIAPIQQAFGKLLPRENIRTWHALPPVCTDIPDNDHRRHVAEAIREDFVQKLKPDVLHITSLFEGFGDNAVHSIKKHGNSPLIAVTFYDLIPLIQKEIYLDPNPHFKKPYYEKIEHLKESDLLLAISESSRREAIDHLGFAENQVVNISAAADEVFRPYFPEAQETIELKQRLGIRNQFIMYSGATDDRKNHRGLIQAYGLLPKSIRDTYQLVLVGGLPLEHRRQFEGYVHQYGLTASDVIITGRVSDKDLIHLYSICDLYVFPSWHEGFGLPALEAMSCGAPVIGSNNTSIPEVIGNERALFDPHSARSIADKILEILSSPELHADLKAHAVTQAARFSWDASARRTLCALEALHEASNKKQQDALPSKNGTSELIPHIAQIFAKCGGRNSINLAHL
ncbi:MAG: glycosyltransferase family 4 protein, partial [Pseudomonadales bacterium]